MRRLTARIQKWCRSLEGKYLRPGYEPNLPDSINIETASVCNLRCSCCPHGIRSVSMRKQGIMSPDTFRRVLDNIDIPVKRAYLHLHGEPFLNPHLVEFVNELTRRQIAVNLYSNCTVIDEFRLDELLNAKRVTINFSADLLGKEYYESIRTGAHYDETLTKLDSINEVFVRHKMFFNIIVILDSSYVSRIDEVVDECEKLYKRYSQLNGILMGSRFPWPRLAETGDLVGHLGKGHQRCTHAFEGLSILWNGDATMCSFDYTGECVVGSLLNDTYSHVFNNKAARHFRMQHWRHKDNELPLCSQCILDRYMPTSVALHRASFLKKEDHEKRRSIESFFRI